MEGGDSAPRIPTTDRILNAEAMVAETGRGCRQARALPTGGIRVDSHGGDNRLAEANGEGWPIQGHLCSQPGAICQLSAERPKHRRSHGRDLEPAGHGDRTAPAANRVAGGAKGIGPVSQQLQALRIQQIMRNR